MLHVGITSCTFPPWIEMCKKNDYETISLTVDNYYTYIFCVDNYS